MTPMRRIKHLLVGAPLANERLEHEKLSKRTALAVLSSDAISSVAYATQQIILALAVLGAAALQYVVPISAVIVGLLVLVGLSYRQTVFAYPGGRRLLHRGPRKPRPTRRTRRRRGPAHRLHPHRRRIDLWRCRRHHFGVPMRWQRTQ